MDEAAPQRNYPVVCGNVVHASHLAAVYRRLAVRRGKQKAIMAVAHRLVVAIYHMLKVRVPYREIGTPSPSDAAKRQLVKRMQRKIEGLEFIVQVSPAPAPAC